MSTTTTRSDPAAALLPAHCPSPETDVDADIHYHDASNEDADIEESQFSLIDFWVGERERPLSLFDKNTMRAK